MPKLRGRTGWKRTDDDNGGRKYEATFLVETEDAELVGPNAVAMTPGLPLPGSIWAQGVDIDPWAFRRMGASVELASGYSKGEKGRFWHVGLTWATPVSGGPTDLPKCSDTQIQDPMLEPPKISGGFTKYTEEATKDRYGKDIVNSAFEQIRGPHNEWDANRQTVRIEQNVATLLQAAVLPAFMMDTVNNAQLWGLPKRTIKLSNGSWEKKYYGQCYFYYNRVLDFDINRATFDRELLDEGTKVLNGYWGTDQGTGCTVTLTVNPNAQIVSAVLVAGGSGYPKSAVIKLGVVQAASGGMGGVIVVTTSSAGVVVSVDEVFNGGSGYASGAATTETKAGWVLVGIGGPANASSNPKNPNPQNPAHFIRFKDRQGENARVVLDGSGKPIDEGEALIQTCTKCPNGIARVWEANGFDGVGIENANFYNGRKMVYTNGCTWTVSFGEDNPTANTLTLTYNNTFEQWELTLVTPTLNKRWQKVENQWQCAGPNAMTEPFNAANQITVTAIHNGGTNAGKIKVEKYTESNLLLLGIPATF